MRIREVAAGLEFPEGPVAMDDGSILVVEIARGTLTRVLPGGRKQVVAKLGGGPNGTASGPDGSVYVCNNGGFEWTREPGGYLRPIGQANEYSGGRIERVQLSTGHVERVYEQVDGIPLCGPNDLVFDHDGGLYFTDLGKVRAGEIDRGAIFYARPDRGAIHAVARPVTTPNGIAISPDGKTLYYAETEGARLWAFRLAGPGKISPEPWPSPQGARMLAASPGGALAALRLDGRRFRWESLRRHPAARRHQHLCAGWHLPATRAFAGSVHDEYLLRRRRYAHRLRDFVGYR